MRLTHAWREMRPEQRLAALASVGLLVTMFFPWYGLQSLNGKTIDSHSINAFGDVSFVEAAVFLVAAGVVAIVLARVEGREFHLPGGDGTIVMVAGGWAAALIFYRVFDRPAGHGYPVGIEWGFFLAFVAAGSLAYAGWRMRAVEIPEPPLRRSEEPSGHRERSLRERPGPQAPRATPVREDEPMRSSNDRPTSFQEKPTHLSSEDSAHLRDEQPTVMNPASGGSERTRPAAASNTRYPPAPATSSARRGARGEDPGRRRLADTDAEQLSFDDGPAEKHPELD